MSWRMAKSLGATGKQGLLGEVNRRAVGRSKVSDGGVGDAMHRKHTSDHNPCRCCGVVCARDFTHDPPDFDAEMFAEFLRERVLKGDARIKYVIWNRQIFSGWKQRHAAGSWRPYTGSNPHTAHIHVSVRHGAEHYDDDSSWGWD